MTTTLTNTITMPVKATMTVTPKEEADKAFADMVHCTIGAALISIEHKSILMNFICVSVFLQQKNGPCFCVFDCPKKGPETMPFTIT